MDEQKRSALLLLKIADCLDVPVEHFTQSCGDHSNKSDIETILGRQDGSLQARQLLQLYWSLPDQSSKDLAVKMMSRLAKDHDAD